MMMDAPWTVATVDRPSSASGDAAARNVWPRRSNWPSSWAARTVLLSGDDVVRTVSDYAHRNNITQIVSAGRQGWRAASAKCLAGRWPRNCCGRRRAWPFTSSPTRRRPRPYAEPARARGERLWDWRGYAIGAAFVAVATGVALAAGPRLRARGSGRRLSVGRSGGGRRFTACGRPWRPRPSAFLAYNFLFLEPRYTSPSARRPTS